MMWKANKTGIIVLAVGLALLALAHYVITPYNESLADQVLALGFCLLLFNVAFASWISAGRSPGGAECDDAPPDADGNGED